MTTDQSGVGFGGEARSVFGPLIFMPRLSSRLSSRLSVIGYRPRLSVIGLVFVIPAQVIVIFPSLNARHISISHLSSYFHLSTLAPRPRQAVMNLGSVGFAGTETRYAADVAGLDGR